MFVTPHLRFNMSVLAQVSFFTRVRRKGGGCNHDERHKTDAPTVVLMLKKTPMNKAINSRVKNALGHRKTITLTALVSCLTVFSVGAKRFMAPAEANVTTRSTISVKPSADQQIGRASC